MKRTAQAVALAATAAALVGGAAASASATTIIGFGNSASNNSCTNHGGTTAQGATTNGPGTVTGMLLALPGSGPANQCGNLGLPTELGEGAEPAEDNIKNVNIASN
ncbi:hypothetical protein ACFWVT_20570 [Streptomyces cyaneofuscatus]|uniref:hypothetical protein n=1 Tax=Streptomyces cyaneofuscatus TaxID=66883 RepID=UPI00364E33F5